MLVISVDCNWEASPRIVGESREFSATSQQSIAGEVYLDFVLINYWEQVYRGGILNFGYVQYFRYHNNLDSLP